MTKRNPSRRIELGRASRVTRGATFGVREQQGLILPGIELIDR
jgi:hypothetical protein